MSKLDDLPEAIPVGKLDGAAVLRKLEAIDEHVGSAGYAINHPEDGPPSPRYHLDAISQYAAEIREMIYAAGLQGDYS